ncbi:glycosyltransferase [Microbacterium thalli]|uniref:glycosyltransferase n=1 Tax=Microbacterium thalli TaxID=3027921 RepID=UPI0023662760|nr:glycosyltransferase [Microbacterium thalli]MDD7930674.1 glycosyltransferase [Microbacterium thalli]
MRIAHVVTYISNDGSFGGPVRVALSQAAALAARGHDVTVYGASPDAVPRTVRQDGYRLRMFPARRLHRALGFAGMFAPGLTRALKAEIHAIDVVHVHLARDLVTLPAARAARKAGVRLIVQPHGMIDRSTNPLAVPVDAWEVRPALRAASTVLTLTDQEQRDIRAIVPTARVRSIGNGIVVADVPDYEGRANEVLFLARLHPRKRAVAFVEMASELIARGETATFTLAGPDEGDGEGVRAAIRRSPAPERIRWIGPVDPALTDALLRRVRVFVLPSTGEIFPMAILEAFAAGTPVVTTDSLGIAAACRGYDAAAVTDGSISALADAVSAVLASSERAHELRTGARTYVTEELGIDRVVAELLDTYGAIEELST